MLRPLAKHALELYATRLPYHRGKWRVIEAGLNAFGIEAADRGHEFKVERQGLHWKLGPDCAIQRKLYYHGALDPYDEREFLSAIRPGSVFFDVGSYYGYYALRAASLGARSFAFEPASVNYQRLAQNVALNPTLSCEPCRLALSDSVGTVAMIVADEGNRGTGRIGAPTDGSVPTEEVATNTLDLFFEEKGLDRLDAMKLDVEGAEMKVLTGGAKTLAMFRPVMLMEYNPGCLRRFGVEPADLLKKVRELGYEIWRATPNGLFLFQAPKPSELYCNVICRPA
jgi:FkbM family methyltransferase